MHKNGSGRLFQRMNIQQSNLLRSLWTRKPDWSRLLIKAGCGTNLGHWHNAPTSSTSVYRKGKTTQGWDGKEVSLLFYTSFPQRSLSNPWLIWILLWSDMNLGLQGDRQAERRGGGGVFKGGHFLCKGMNSDFCAFYNTQVAWVLNNFSIILNFIIWLNRTLCGNTALWVKQMQWGF